MSHDPYNVALDATHSTISGQPVLVIFIDCAQMLFIVLDGAWIAWRYEYVRYAMLKEVDPGRIADRGAVRK